jgi:aspartate/methionine/tyrosine aminotransferase
MHIAEFAVERWMDRHEAQCRYNLAESCVDSLTVGELLALAGLRVEALEALLPLKLTYGAIAGSDRLRTLVAGLYSAQTPGNVLVTHGAAGANALVYETLIDPGDRVITVQPCYQQHVSIAESYGAEVHSIRLHEADGFLADLGQMARLATTRTKLIALTNPNNPTGALMNRAQLEEVAQIAASCGAWVLCDEVYRGLDQEGEGTTASMADVYERGVSTGSMSKAYSLAGLRLGWIVGPHDLLHEVAIHRDYSTISVGVIDDHLAALALEHKEALLSRSRAIVRDHLAVLDGWVAAEARVSYVKPRSGTTALLKVDGAVPSRDFCVRLLESTGVLLVPGSAMGMEGYVRIGYANSRPVLDAGLAAVSGFLRSA